MSNTKEVAEVKISVPDGVVKQEGDFKMPKPKAKPKNLSNNTKQPIKVDFTKQEKDAIRIKETGGLDENKPTGDLVKMDQSIQESSKDVENKEEKTIVEDKDSPIQLITDEESNIDESGVARSNETTNAASEQKEIQKEVETPKLPENIEKLVQFMEKTGGTIEDYTRLNADYSNINDAI